MLGQFFAQAEFAMGATGWLGRVDIANKGVIEMISREDVVYAYRLLLGREPENEAVVTHYATEVQSLKVLRGLFMSSMEFRQSLTKSTLARMPKPVMPATRMRVELQASPDKLAALLNQVGKQWQHLGETEPHWSVLTNEGYFQENFQTNKAAFYASGDGELKVFEGALSRAGLSAGAFKSCVELGCGVGRMTVPLARLFERTLGVDVSAAHLALASQRVQELGVGNIAFQRLEQVDGLQSLPAFDVLYSRIVLQHNPPPVMGKLLADLLARLNPGGVAYFQIPTYKAGYRFQIDEYLAAPNHTDMEVHYYPQDALMDLLAAHHCRVLEMREDDAIGVSSSVLSNTLLVQKAG